MPVLVNGDCWIAGSWTIANYLEDTFPDSPSLFGGASGRDLTRYYSSLADGLGAAIFPFVAFDIWQHVADKDRDYFRASREKRVGKTLEALVADRQARVPAFRFFPFPNFQNRKEADSSNLKSSSESVATFR